MNIRQYARSVLELMKDYQAELKELSEEEFCRVPDEGGWSCSEIYCHILQVNVRCLLAMEKCIYGKQWQGRIAVPVVSRLILYFGWLPSGRIKIPDNIASKVKIITRENAKNDLIKFVAKLEEILPKILKCSPYKRIRHPRLGMLNCNEWMRFTEIYSKHYLKIIKRRRKTSA